MKIKFFDAVIVIIALLIIGMFSFFAYAGGGGSGNVIITSPRGTWEFSLQKDGEAEIPGPIGITKVIIENGAVRVAASPCREKICIQSGPISRTGSWIACVPNRVFIQIESSNRDQADATAF